VEGAKAHPAPPSARSLHSEETDTNKAGKEQCKSYKDAAPVFEERTKKLEADIKGMHQKLAEATEKVNKVPSSLPNQVKFSSSKQMENNVSKKQEQSMEKNAAEEKLNEVEQEMSTSQVVQMVPQNSNRKIRERI